MFPDPANAIYAIILNNPGCFPTQAVKVSEPPRKQKTAELRDSEHISTITNNQTFRHQAIQDCLSVRW